MSRYLWIAVARDEHHAATAFWHMVPEADQHTSLCGHDVQTLGESWRIRDELGNYRPCDRCTEVAAVHEDAGDQLPVEVPA